MEMGYRPDIDSHLELDQDGIVTFQELFVILRWAVDIGGVDILSNIYTLSSYQDFRREAHLEQIYHLFTFLKKKPKSNL